jgi:RNA polymerase sigma-70 factor (ECF subfamily)
MSVSIEQIWKEYHNKLHDFVKKRVGDPSLADDLLQEIFLKILAKIQTLKANQKLPSWIYQIARNTIIDYFRTRKSAGELPESLSAPEDEQSDQALQEIAVCLAPMIQNLPVHYREAIEMAELEGLTQKEVAARQNLSLTGAKSRIQRGRGLLKDMLLECCRFEMDTKGKIIDYEQKGDDCKSC